MLRMRAFGAPFGCGEQRVEDANFRAFSELLYPARVQSPVPSSEGPGAPKSMGGWQC